MPTTTTGLATSFINFSRPGASGGGATVTDSDGKIKWAGHNLLTNSESFDAATYTKGNVTVGANAAVAPNGTTTADKIEATATAATSMTASVSNAGPCTLTVWAKKGNSATAMNVFGLRNFTTSTNVLFASVNYDTGAVTYIAGSSGVTVVDAGSGWWRITLSPSSGFSAGDTAICYLSDWGTSRTAGDHCYLWGAHLYRSDLGSMQLNPAMPSGMQTYYPTTPRNLLGYTEDFSNAAWAKANTVVTSNAIIAPNGLQTADHIALANATSGGSFFQSGGPTWSSNSIVLFNLSTGTVGTVTSGSFTSTSITPVGDGWYRCAAVKDGYTLSFYGKAGAWSSVAIQTSGSERMRFYPSTSSTSVTGTGDGTSGIYLWGAQLSDSASLDTYVPVYGAAVTSAAYYAPRLDFDPVTLAAKGLLVEEQRVNLALQSEAIDTASWQKFALNTTGTPQWVNAATAPDGTMTADKIIPNTTSTDYHGFQSNAAITVDNAAAYTWSIYAKADGYDWVAIDAYNNGLSSFTWFNLATGSVGTNAAGNTAPPPVPVGNGWYRLTVTRTTANTTAYFIIRVANADNTPTFAGDGTKGVLVWGAQLEKGSFATSYIPTGSATATRTADVASVSTQAFPYSASEGTIVAKLIVDANGDRRHVSLTDGTTSKLIDLYRSSAANKLVGAVVNTSGQFTSANGPAATTGSVVKHALAFKANDFAYCANGGAVETGPSGSVPTGITKMNIGFLEGSSVQYANGHIQQITYIPRRLTAAELQSRTA